MFSHPAPDHETFGAGPAHLIPTGDDGSPESPFADQTDRADTGAAAHEASHAVGDEFDPGHHATVFHDPDAALACSPASEPVPQQIGRFRWSRQGLIEH